LAPPDASQATAAAKSSLAPPNVSHNVVAAKMCRTANGSSRGSAAAKMRRAAAVVVNFIHFGECITLAAPRLPAAVEATQPLLGGF
jgi:hypothetical protein